MKSFFDPYLIGAVPFTGKEGFDYVHLDELEMIVIKY